MNNSLALFWAKVIRKGGEIISIDTLNLKHLGPRCESVLQELDKDKYNTWSNNWGNIVWGDDYIVDGEAWDDLRLSIESLVPSGLWFGFSEGDGACLGFWVCDPEKPWLYRD